MPSRCRSCKQWLDEAKAKGIGKAFITFHYPVFARAGLGAIPEPDNPHELIASYAKDMEIIVFNGHVHTTEMYDVDGVKYLMLGGGGAEQDPILPGRTSIKVPADYPPDLYWKGEPPKEEYNYVLVDVEPGQKTKFTLNRFRPWSAEPFATVRAVRGSIGRADDGGAGMATALLIVHGLVAVALLGAVTHQTLATGRRRARGPVRSSAAFAPCRPPHSPTPSSFSMRSPRCWARSCTCTSASTSGPSWNAPATGRRLASSTSRSISSRSGWHCCRPTGFAGGGRVPTNPLERAPL